MRRLLLLLAVLAVAVAASILAARADDDAAGSDPDGDDATASVTTPLLSASRAWQWVSQPAADQEFAAAATNVLANADPVPDRSCLSVHRDGVEIAAVNATEQSLIPGSLLRIITAAAVFDTLPAGTRFLTDVVVEGGLEQTDGVYTGDVWLVGRGDPVLSTSAYIGRFDDGRAFTNVEELAQDVAERLLAGGINTVDGSVLGDESAFAVQRDYQGDVWDADDNAANQVGPLSRLLVDDGFSSWPQEVDQAANERSANPPLEAASIFTELLGARGVVVTGAPGTGSAPTGQTGIGQINSPTVDRIVARAMTDGTTAEMLTKELGIRLGTDGLRENTMGAVYFFPVLGLGLPLPSDDGLSLLADGSGLSDQNLVPCAAIAATLVHPEVGAQVADAMPAIGDTGLAACAPVGTDGMRVLATAEEDTTGVAGVLTADNGDRISFVMMANGPGLGAALGDCNGLQASLLDVVAGHPYGPEAPELAAAPTTDTSESAE